MGACACSVCGPRETQGEPNNCMHKLKLPPTDNAPADLMQPAFARTQHLARVDKLCTTLQLLEPSAKKASAANMLQKQCIPRLIPDAIEQSGHATPLTVRQAKLRALRHRDREGVGSNAACKLASSGQSVGPYAAQGQAVFSRRYSEPAIRDTVAATELIGQERASVDRKWPHRLQTFVSEASGS